MTVSRLIILIAVASAGSLLHADVKLPAVIGDNMVLQQSMPLKIWGWAKAGESITVSIASQKVQTTADDKGNWMVKLEPMKASAEPMEMIVAGKNTITVKNILVGEVWVCSGQSNMEVGVEQAANPKEEIANADHPAIRFFNICPTKHTAAKPDINVKASWQVCTPETARPFSAVGYFFGRHLNQTVKVPVGLINASWGASPIEQWIPMDSYLNDPQLSVFVPKIEKGLKDYPEEVRLFNERREVWKATTQKIVATRPSAATQPRTMLPHGPPGPWHPHIALGGMYNGNIAPLNNFAIRGVIWYQGESNSADPVLYRKTFPALIRGWRKAWGQGDFPFLYVQLANWTRRVNDPNTNHDWARLREAQTMTLATPNTGMAVIIDVGDAADIHPKDKQTVGYRLGLISQNIALGQKDVKFSGPMFEAMKVEGSKLIVKFKHADGLAGKGQKITGFAIAGADGKYAWADALIDGDSVVLTSDEVPAPSMVRYGWQNNPDCNLYNDAGLPACPFRSGEPDTK